MMITFCVMITRITCQWGRLSVTKSKMIIEHLLTHAELESQDFPSSIGLLFPGTRYYHDSKRDCVQCQWARVLRC